MRQSWISTVTLLSNDSDVDGDTLSSASFTQPTNGTLVDNGDGTLTYVPAADYHGTDSFTYTVIDGSGGFDIVTVNVTINSVNDSPIILDDSYAVNQGETLHVDGAGVLVNDRDVDGNAARDTCRRRAFTRNARTQCEWKPSATYRISVL